MTYERIFPTDCHGNPLGPAREEIVRCGDCIERVMCKDYERTWPELTEYEYGWCRSHHLCVDSRHFCSWGVRADA